MAIPSGLSGQVGFVEEPTWGTPVTVSRFLEFVSESIKTNVQRVETKGIRGQLVQRADRTHVYVKDAHGSLTLPVANKNMGLLFEHWLGLNTITGAGANKSHAITVSATNKSGKGLTIQVGRPDTSGTVRAFTYEGGKIVSGELNLDADGALMFVPEFDFQTLLVATALASASYVTTQENFYYDQAGTLTVGGTNMAPVKSFKFKFTPARKIDRRGLGNVKSEQVPNGEWVGTGTLECEFTDRTAYDSFVAGTTAALSLPFTLSTVIPTTAVPYSLTLAIPLIQYTEGNVNVDGPDVLKQSLAFKILDDGSSSPITLTYVTSDSAS